MIDTKKEKRKTHQQALIRGLFQTSERPLSAQELLDIAVTIQPGIGMATVYRGIKTLMEDNFITQVEIPGTSPRYERTAARHHHHFLCKKCDKVFTVGGCAGHLDKLIPPGFVMDSHKIVIEGRCMSCTPGH